MQPSFDLAAAHRYFSAACFNRAWDWIGKPDHSTADDDAMIHCGHASLWHWQQRADVTNRNMSIGYWQLSRIYALVRQPENARRYGQLCLNVSLAEPPFYLGFAYEALARAAALAGDRAAMQEFFIAGQTAAAQVADLEERRMLLGDLLTIQGIGAAPAAR